MPPSTFRNDASVAENALPVSQENPLFTSGASANLDFLRTFAVLLVVARHLMSVFGIGDSRWIQPQAIGIFGVLLFFVHTSLVLMFSLERQTQRLGTRHFYTTFLVRRIFRIYPLSICVVLSLVFAGSQWPVAASGLVGHLTVAGIVSNIFLVQDFAHQPNITGVLWSLPLEMQMYLFLPVLFFYAKRLKTSGLLWLWAGGVALGLLHAKYLALPQLFEYISCFLPGVLCYTLARQKPALPFWLFPVFLVLLLAVYQTAYGILHHGQAIFGMPACLMLGVLLPRFREMPSKMLASACKIIARYSYGIYLLHWNAVWLAFIFLHSSPVLTQWAVFAAGFVLGPLLVYHVIEEPMIKLGNCLVGYIHKSRLTPQP
jgi:peptidoglycan/LPS O-acetylase OafA/YrhL